METNADGKIPWSKVAVVVVVLILILIIVWQLTKSQEKISSVVPQKGKRKPQARGNEPKVNRGNAGNMGDGIPRPSVTFDNLLTSKECKEVIKKYTEKFGQKIKDHDKRDPKNHYQRMVQDPKLIGAVKKRLEERIIATEPMNPRLREDMSTWRFHDHVRIVHYSPGQEKTLHKDTRMSENGRQTAYTCLVYLNDVPEENGGRTISYPHLTEKYRSATHAPRMTSPEGESILYGEDEGEMEVNQPVQGKAAMYDIHLLHRGEPITAGEKWLAIFKILV